MRNFVFFLDYSRLSRIFSKRTSHSFASNASRAGDARAWAESILKRLSPRNNFSMFAQSEGDEGFPRRFIFDDVYSDPFYSKAKNRGNSFPRHYPRSSSKERRSEFEIPTRSPNNKDRDHSGNFSPPESAQDILNRLKNSLKGESDMFYHSNPEFADGMHSRKVGLSALLHSHSSLISQF